MAHAYTPGLRATRQATLRRPRRLPLKGDVLVDVGAAVTRDQVVARTALPGNVTTLNLVNRLGVTPDELPAYMLKQEGDPVTAGEPIAQTRPFIKWFRTTVEAPVTGQVESISPVTGQVMLREPPRPVEVLAYVDGVVAEVLPGDGVVVETRGAFVQGIFGVGGEGWGPLRSVTASPDETLDAGGIGPECSGQVLVGGSLVTHSAVERAQEVGAVGIIAGGIGDGDLRTILGRDLGVAITGTEEIGLTLIVTEGFGQIAMAPRTFEILASCAGQQASISGATQIRAGVVRPEIIVPQEDDTNRGADVATPQSAGLELGDTVRAIRAPHFGRIGQVASLPSELRQVESGARVRVLEVAFEGGTRAVVPRANVELIEE